MKKLTLTVFALIFSSLLYANTTVTDWKPTSCKMTANGSSLTIGFPYTYNSKKSYSTVPHCQKDVLQVIEIPDSMDVNHALAMCLTAIQANVRIKIDALNCDNGVLKPTADTTFTIRR